MTVWNDFNDAEQQQSFDLIPKGTIAWVRMSIKPGGYNDPNQGWTGGWATRSDETGAVYLACEFVVLEGPYARRKLWSNIGLYSPKGPTWTGMGRSFLRALLNSARRVRADDNSPQAAAARRIQGFHELEGIEFVAKIDVERDNRGDPRNIIKQAVEPDQPDYPGGSGPGPGPASAAAARAPAPAVQGTHAVPTGRPTWAQ
jgi:hypothetical protein